MNEKLIWDLGDIKEKSVLGEEKKLPWDKPYDSTTRKPVKHFIHLSVLSSRKLEITIDHLTMLP